MRFLLLGDFRQLPAVLDSFAGAEVCRELKDSQLLHDLAGGWCHELSERWRFDEGVFSFLQWLRVDEAEQVPLREAVQMARQRFPRRGEPEVCLIISHAKRLQINEREKSQASAGGCAAGEYAGPETAGTNAPQTMRVWPGLRLVGRRRQSAEGRLRDRQRSGRASVAGKRAELRAPGAAEAHPPLQRHHLRFRAGPDPPGPGLALRRGLSPFHHEASLHGLLPGHQQRTYERFVTCFKVHSIGGTLNKAGF